jgi:hypothetical protein
MTTETSNAIVAFGTIILALCAVGALCLNFWKSPKPVEAKVAIVRNLGQLIAIAAVIATCYFMTTTEQVGWPVLCSTVAFLVEFALFATSPYPVSRVEILTIAAVVLFTADVPVFTSAKAFLKLHSMTV